MSRTDFDFESRLVPLLVRYATEQGLEVGALLAQWALPQEVVTQPMEKGPIITKVSVLPALADAVAAKLNDPHLGLSLAAWSPKGVYGVAEFLANAGPTLRDAFESTVRYTGLLAPAQTFRIEERADELELHHTVTLRPGAIGRHFEEYVSAVLIKSLVTLTAVKPTRAWFTHGRADDSDFERLAAGLHTGDVSYGAPTNGFAVSGSALGLPVQGGDAALRTFLDGLAQTALAARPASDDLVEKVRSQLHEALQHGEPNIERVATRLNLSGRTLQRRLSDLQTSFQAVLDSVRFDLARGYLKDPRLDLTQIAFLLGYSELRAFDRAFRRWAELSPGEWRQRAS